MPALPWGLAPFCPLKAMKGCRWDFRAGGGTGTISIDTPDSTRRTRPAPVGTAWCCGCGNSRRSGTCHAPDFAQGFARLSQYSGRRLAWATASTSKCRLCFSNAIT
jgi:hypothetical protein